MAFIASQAYKEGGIGALANGVISGKFTSARPAQYRYMQPAIKAFTVSSLLANLAVSPSYRRSGLGRALCDECVSCTTGEWGIGEIALQVRIMRISHVSLHLPASPSQLLVSQSRLLNPPSHSVSLRISPPHDHRTSLQVEEDNTPACTLYRKDGYRQVCMRMQSHKLHLYRSPCICLSHAGG